MQITWANQKRTLRELLPWPRNPRHISDEQAARLVQSVEDFGQVETLAIGPDGDVYNGHQRLSVLAGRYGMDHEVEVRVSSRPLTEKERERLTIYLHKGASGEFDWGKLSTEFEFDDLVAWGFPEDDLFAHDMEPQNDNSPGADTPPEMSRADELLQEWQTDVGQLWACGDHRLIIGDCTDEDVVARVMGGDKASLVFTDPPYGVAIGEKNRMLNYSHGGERNATPIESDSLSPDDLKLMLLPAFINIKTIVMADDCTVFVTAPQGGELCMMMMMMKESGLPVRHVLIWKKNSPTFSMGRLDYDYQHEPILLTWGKRHKRPMRGSHKTSIWEIDKPRASPYHPTTKPVELVENALLNNSDNGDIAYDPFAGSGTTGVACHNLGRQARMIEISPAYGAVILERLSKHVGVKPELIP